MKTEAALRTSLALGALARANKHLNRADELVPSLTPGQTPACQALLEAQRLVREAHAHARRALELLEEAEKEGKTA